MKNNKKIVLGAVVGFLVLAALFTAVWLTSRPDAAVGDKTIHVAVVAAQDVEKNFDIQTDAATLRQALEEQGLIAGEESLAGLFVTTVDGVTAEPDKEFWSFTKDGQWLDTGVDDTLIEDGDSFVITLTAM